MIKAEIIADSKNEFGQRITTFILVFPRIVLAEFNTHRMISRNSASSRAIPFERMLAMVKENPFIPIKWMKDHKGMQGTEYFPKEYNKELTSIWLKARDEAIWQSTLLSNKGMSKQICNRLLEPFMWHTVIATGTEWENFFALRAHEAAEIHIQELAHKMLEAYNNTQPKLLRAGEWHVPFGDKFDDKRIGAYIDEVINTKGYDHISSNEMVDRFGNSYPEYLKACIATARCARVSYMNFDGSDDYGKDMELYERLASSGHWSPFEHCAKAMNQDEFRSYMFTNSREITRSPVNDVWSVEGWCGNFRGFIQYRKMFNNENQRDNRVKK